MGRSALVHVGLALALLVVIRRVERPDVTVSQSVAVVFASPEPAASLPLDRHDAAAAMTPAQTLPPPAEPQPSPIPPPPSPPMPVVTGPPPPVASPPRSAPPPPHEAAPSPPTPVAPLAPEETSPPVELPLPPRAPPPPPARRLRSASLPVSRPPASVAPPTTMGEVAQPGTHAAAAPAITPPAAVAGWREALSAWLAAHRNYPEDARRRGDEGRAAVRFTMDRSGRVLEVELSQSSGSAILDEAARTMLRGATLPPLPATMTQERITVTVTIRYALAP